MDFGSLLVNKTRDEKLVKKVARLQKLHRKLDLISYLCAQVCRLRRLCVITPSLIRSIQMQIVMGNYPMPVL